MQAKRNMGSTGAICLSLVLFVGGISISSSCSIVDVSKCYRLLLSQSSVYGFCNTIPSARRCMSDLARSNKCLTYFQKLVENAVVSLDDLGESPRCRRYGRRRYTVPEQLTDRRDQNRRQQVGEERKDRYEVTRRRVVVAPEQKPSYETERRRVQVDDRRRTRTDDRPQPIRRRYDQNGRRYDENRRGYDKNRRENDENRRRYDENRRQSSSRGDAETRRDRDYYRRRQNNREGLRARRDENREREETRRRSREHIRSERTTFPPPPGSKMGRVTVNSLTW